MRLFLFLFFIMLKLHKPVILSEKQINNSKSNPKSCDYLYKLHCYEK